MELDFGKARNLMPGQGDVRWISGPVAGAQECAPAYRIAIVGSGPRGVAVLERMAARVAQLHPGRPVQMCLIDAEEVGCGRLWRSDQPEWFLMNTVCGEVTMFSGPPDDGPARPGSGPSLAEWWSAHEPGFPGKDGYAPRRVHGRYLRYVVDTVERTLPEGAGLRRIRARVEDVAPMAGGGYRLSFAEGADLCADKVVLATGHARPEQVGQFREFAEFAAARPHLRYFAGDSVADMPLEKIPDRSRVGAIGLGLSFYDLMLALSVGRGGSFTEAADGSLAYLPSGREPLLVAGSRSGVPLPARGRNQKPSTLVFEPVLFTPARIRRRTVFGQIRFMTDVFPWNLAEVELVYYRTALRERDGEAAAARFTGRVVAAAEDGVPEVAKIAAEFGVADLPPLDFDQLARPFAGRHFADTAEFDEALSAHMRKDLEHAERGNHADPLKAALDVMRDTRWVVRDIVDFGGLRPDSHRDEFLGWFAPRSAMLAAGPPRIRVRQAMALRAAGVLRVVGPDSRFTTYESREGRFMVSSAKVAGSTVAVDTLIDARTPVPDVGRDPAALTRNLLARGTWTEFVNGRGPRAFRTGGVAVTRSPFHPVGDAGRTDAGLYVLGVPTEHTRWFTLVGSSRPGPWNEFTRDADAIARDALRALRPKARTDRRQAAQVA
jgi:hypothetical protein